jgi:hypothetical protein
MLKSAGPCTTSVTVAECVRVPLVPVIVRVYVPAGVVDAVETVSVALPEPETDAGLKLAEAPVGNPPTDRLAVPVKPFTALIDVVYVALLPCATVCELGVAEMLKSDGPCTINVTVPVCVRVPLVPVIVSVYVPAGVVVAVVTDNVELPEPETDVGLRLAVAPVGNPLTLRFTVSVKPFSALSVVV